MEEGKEKAEARSLLENDRLYDHDILKKKVRGTMVGAINTRVWNNGCQNSDSLVSRADGPVHHTLSRTATDI